VFSCVLFGRMQPAANGNVTSSSSARAEGGKYEGQPPLPETPQQTLERYIINTYKRNYETFYQVDNVSLTFVSENTNKIPIQLLF